MSYQENRKIYHLSWICTIYEYSAIVWEDDQNYSTTTLTFKSSRDLFNLSTSSWREVALVFSNSTESSNLFFTSSFPSTFCSKAVNLKAIIFIIYQSNTEGVKQKRLSTAVFIVQMKSPKKKNKVIGNLYGQCSYLSRYVCIVSWASAGNSDTFSDSKLDILLFKSAMIWQIVIHQYHNLQPHI